MIYEFMATQDLHGYGKPWAPGANVNLLPPALEAKTYETTSTILTAYPDGHYHLTKSAETATSTSVRIDLLESVEFTTDNYITVVAPLTQAFGGSIGNLVTAENTYLQSAGVGLGGNSKQLTSAGEAAKLYIYNANTSVIDADIYPMVTDEAITNPLDASSFTPYANVCMPEGFNIWDPDNAEYVQVYAGYVNANTRELYLRPVYEEYDGEELVGPWMSSIDPYEEDTMPSEGAFVIDFGGELSSYEITPFMLQTLLDSLGIRQHFTNGAGLLNSLMDQAQGRVRSEEELLHLSRPLNVIAIGDQLPAGLTFKPISKDVLPGLPGKFIR